MRGQLPCGPDHKAQVQGKVTTTTPLWASWAELRSSLTLQGTWPRSLPSDHGPTATRHSVAAAPVSAELCPFAALSWPTGAGIMGAGIPTVQMGRPGGSQEALGFPIL